LKVEQELQISKRDLRRHQRVQYLGPARISWEDANGFPKYAQGSCLDVSASGLRMNVEVFEPIPVRSRVSLRVDRIKLAGSATVRHVARRGAKFVVGLEMSQAFGADALCMIGNS
jgi:hypothetical protein